MSSSTSMTTTTTTTTSTALTVPSATSSPRRSLRERCGITFSLGKLAPPKLRGFCSPPIELPPQKSNIIQPTNNGPIGPHVSNLPRRKPKPKAAPVVPITQSAVTNINNNPNPPAALPRLPRRKQVARPPVVQEAPQAVPQPLSGVSRFVGKDESRCLQQIIPGCFIAFEDDTTSWDRGVTENGQQAVKETLEPRNGECWTHVISITRPPPQVACTCESACNCDNKELEQEEGKVVEDHAAHTLNLTLPPSSNTTTYVDLPTPHSVCLSADAADEPIDDNNTILLKTNQLIAARDFLSCHGRSLPYPLTPSDPTASPSFPTPVRILITTPRNHRTDALAVASCFLAYAFNMQVGQVVTEINTRKDCLSVWKAGVGPKAVKFIEQAVRI
jgi:hypothetical protein